MSHTVPHMFEVKAGPLSVKPLNTIIEATNSIPETANTLGNQQMMQLKVQCTIQHEKMHVRGKIDKWYHNMNIHTY